MGEIKFYPEVLIVNDLFIRNISLFTETAENKNIKLHGSALENIAVVADENMSDLVLRNLISNAIKFTHAGGEIKLSAEMEGEWVCIKVVDNGIGITEEDLSSILNPAHHFTTQGTNQERGTGFGLLLCKEFVEKNGGQMSVKSDIGEGTSVSFTLKLTPNEPKQTI